jgi:glycerophosphoryl diester phosphodiesterase
MGIFRRPFVYLHYLIVATAVIVILASVTLIGFLIFWQDIAEEMTTGRRPTQFNGPLDADLLDDYGLVFSVGHNSGGTLAATRQALKNGADVIEIDVASLDGQLVSAHFPPLPIVGRRVFRGPTLEEVWRASTAADVIKLDLKESSPQFRALLFAFLNSRQDERQIIVSSRDPVTLSLLMHQAPSAFRFLSVPDQATLDRVYRDYDLNATIEGVSIRQSLLEAESATQLRALGLIIVAWTVNDLTRVNELVRLGVDGITTDNLAIMKLLGGERNGERRLSEHRSPPAAWQQPPDHYADQRRE